MNYKSEVVAVTDTLYYRVSTCNRGCHRKVWIPRQEDEAKLDILLDAKSAEEEGGFAYVRPISITISRGVVDGFVVNLARPGVTKSWEECVASDPTDWGPPPEWDELFGFGDDS